VDITNNDSPDSRTEFVSGLSTSGEASFDMVFNGANHPSAIMGVSKLFSIIIPKTGTASQATVVSFLGYVKGWGLSIPMKGATVVKGVTLKVSGAITIAAYVAP
jgi:hypothetical protein